MTDETFAIVGAGKAGTAIATVIKGAGRKIVAVSDQDEPKAQRAAQILQCETFHSQADAVRQANRIIIATPDDAIQSVCRTIAEEGALHAGMIVIHLSGAGGLDLLAAAQDCGAGIACIHPVQSFSDILTAADRISGSTFGVTTTADLQPWAFQLVRDIGGTPFAVSEKDRPLYHAAACVASNYLVTLMHLAQEMYITLGLPADEARRAFWPLVQGTITNMEQKGIPDALTGPIARGDVGTIHKHLETLRDTMPSALPAYKLLGAMTADLARQKGTLTESLNNAIKTILGGNCHE